MYSYTTNNQNMKVDFIHRTIIVSKKFMNQASKVGTSEYELMLRMTRELPTFTIAMKEIARSTHRPFQPTYSAMEAYIQLVETDVAAAMDEFQEVRHMARLTMKGYSLVRRWFLEKYPDCSEHTDNSYEFSPAI